MKTPRTGINKHTLPNGVVIVPFAFLFLTFVHRPNLFRSPPPSNLTTSQILELYNLVDDCSLPSSSAVRASLWRYICHMSGASLHAASLLRPYPSPSGPRPLSA